METRAEAWSGEGFEEVTEDGECWRSDKEEERSLDTWAFGFAGTTAEHAKNTRSVCE